MCKHRFHYSILLLLLFFTVFVQTIAAAPQLGICGQEDSDLEKVLTACEIPVTYYQNIQDAFEKAPENSGLLVLAGGYPEQTTPIPDSSYRIAANKGLRLYIEYPANVPGYTFEEPIVPQWERAVLSSEIFGETLQPLRILAIHGCRYLPVKAESPWIVSARVAGYDTAVYGLPDTVSPLLFQIPGQNTLIATTQLSRFQTGRYAPVEAWQTIWQTLLKWLCPGETFPDLVWTSAVRPSYSGQEPLPMNIEKTAIRRGSEWYINSRMLLSEADDKAYRAIANPNQRVREVPPLDTPPGDGRFGVLEGFASNIAHDGSQLVRWWRRGDCNGESAMALAAAGTLAGDRSMQTWAANVCDYILSQSLISQGDRMNPTNDAYGLLGWNDVPKYHGDMDGYGVYYGDDNARVLLGSIATSGLLEIDRWDKRILMGVLGNFRTAGPLGFRGGRIDTAPLNENGWRYYYEKETINYWPHYEAYLWACYLWAYQITDFEPFLEKARTAIRMTMEAYPDNWSWTNGIQQERARMLLPLAWLIRIEDTEEHRTWLKHVADDLLVSQDECGAIREQLGDADKGSYGAVPSNEAYGTTETPLIQTNGDPACDLLYTTNFAFIGLHEAYEATQDSYYGDAEDRLAEFLCRIQVRSESHPELDGAWFRACDFRRWEYWASNADAGWGAWSVETGWTQGWIVSVLGMRQLRTSLWELGARSQAGEHFEELYPIMIPADN